MIILNLHYELHMVQFEQAVHCAHYPIKFDSKVSAEKIYWSGIPNIAPNYSCSTVFTLPFLFLGRHTRRANEKWMHRPTMYWDILSVYSKYGKWNTRMGLYTQHKGKKTCCIGVTRPTLKIPPTLYFLCVCAICVNMRKKLRNCHKKS